MKALLIAFGLVLITTPAFAAELQLGFYPVASENDGPTCDLLFEIEKKADRTIWYDKEENFDLGLGEVIDGARHSMDLKFDQIKSFLKKEKHKDLIVVWFDKTVMWNEKPFIEERAKKVTGLLQEAGYKRVVILGAHAFGAHYVADTSLKRPVEK